MTPKRPLRLPARDAFYRAVVDGLLHAQANHLDKPHDIAICIHTAMDAAGLTVRYQPTTHVE